MLDELIAKFEKKLPQSHQDTKAHEAFSLWNLVAWCLSGSGTYIAYLRIWHAHLSTISSPAINSLLSTSLPSGVDLVK